MPLLVEYWEKEIDDWSFHSLTGDPEETFSFAATAASAYTEYKVVCANKDVYIVFGGGCRRYRYPQGTSGASVIYNWALKKPLAVCSIERDKSWEIVVQDYYAKVPDTHRLRFQVVADPDLPEVLCPICYRDQHPMTLLTHVQHHSWSEISSSGYTSDHELMREVYDLLMRSCAGLPADGYEIQALGVLMHQALECAEHRV